MSKLIDDQRPIAPGQPAPVEAASDEASIEIELGLGGSQETTDPNTGDPGGGTISEAPGLPNSTLDLPEAAPSPNRRAGPGDGLVNATTGEQLTAELPGPPLYRPTRRPPTALIRVLDDGSLGGEEVRVRKTPFDVGRLDGDFVIAHELQMSRRHFRIDRHREGEDKPWQWTLEDLQSLNGTFLRRDSGPIDDGAEVLIGGELVRFQLMAPGRALALMKVGPDEVGERLSVSTDEAWIGSDPARCLPFLSGNPFLDPRHASLRRDREGAWMLTDETSVNGLWFRITRTPLTEGDQWQAGEQRFVFRPL